MIDLRSDTVTRPSKAMYQAMAEAAVGDDVMGEDPTTKQLERTIAELAGMEAALFVPTATQSNLIAILSHCQRGDEYLCGQGMHCYRFEGGGGAVAGGVQPQPLPMREDGTLCLDELTANIKPEDPHFARSRLICLENTYMGMPLPIEYVSAVRELATSRGLALHIDGARIFHAAVYYKRPLKEVVCGADTLTVCLSKGLGCPAGALLCGSREVISQARRWRKLLGGGMRQSGVLAAAGCYALENNVERLREDHRHAQQLGEALLESRVVRHEQLRINTNMVFVELPPLLQAELRKLLLVRGVLIMTGYLPDLRFVLHKDLSAEQVFQAADALIAVFKELAERG